MPPFVKKILIALFTGAILVSPLVFWLNNPNRTGDDAMPVLTQYLKLLYARDLRQAYRYISSVDRRLKKRDDYVRERGAFTGFTLEAARKLAESIEFHPLSQQTDGTQNRVKVAMKLPDANGLSSLLLDWDEQRLNALPAPEQKKILAAIDDLARSKKLPLLEGEEQFVLVKEDSRCKVFLSWAAGVKVRFATYVPPGALIAEPTSRNTVVRSGDVFTVGFKVKNTTRHELRTRIIHSVEPKEHAQYFALVECALLLPVRLRPGEEQTYNSTYNVRGDLPDGAKALTIVYEFKLEP